MKYSKMCEHCGKASVAYPRKINQPLVAALRKLVIRYRQTGKPAKLKALNLGNSQHSNFNWLAYFGLTYRNGSDGWIPTRKAEQFLNGKETIPSFLLVMDGDVLPAHHEAWKAFSYKLERHTVYDVDPMHETEEHWKEFKRQTLFDNLESHA